MTRNGLLPRLDLFITLGTTGYATTFPDSFRELNGPTYDVTAGVSLSQLLGNRTAEARDQAALASRQQAALAIDNLEQIVELDVRLAVNEAERAREQIAASTPTRQLQEETVQAETSGSTWERARPCSSPRRQRDLLVAQIERSRRWSTTASRWCSSTWPKAASWSAAASGWLTPRSSRSPRQRSS